MFLKSPCMDSNVESQLPVSCFMVMNLCNSQGVSTEFQYFFHDFYMTKALKSRTFYMLHGMKETCTEAMREDATSRFCLWEPRTRLKSQYGKMWKTSKLDLITYTYPCTEMLDERKENCCFVRECLLISMTFYEFSKTWSQFPWLLQAWKRKNGIPWLFQVFHDWIHPEQLSLVLNFMTNTSKPISLTSIEPLSVESSHSGNWKGKILTFGRGSVTG